jgi:hypothetical protein
MNHECNIIRDLLPLYQENLISEETRAFVDKHLAGCAECRKRLQELQTPMNTPQVPSAAPLKGIKRKLLQKKVETIVLTAALVLAILAAAFSFLTSPEYLPYAEDLFTISVDESEVIRIAFNEEEVTGYMVNLSQGEETDSYFIHAWKTIWEEHFSQGDSQNAGIRPVAGKQIAVYYSPNNAEEAVLVYGANSNTGVVNLPRLVLSYYFILAILAFVVLTVLRFLLRNKQAICVWIERVLLFPAAYLLGHVCVKGFSMKTYSIGRDVSLILLIAILFYLAGLLGINLYRGWKEKKNNMSYFE